ncbi:MAG: DUF1385 domain-containing protein [Clostridia bacterium]|nr:DUF1385 domain-containing protein [Clostridia bacterium]
MNNENKENNNCTSGGECPTAPCAKKTSIGGQALLEGIMMRGPKKSAMAVRNTKGEIVIEETELPETSKKSIKKIPIIRGVFAYIDSLMFGSKCLMRSAELSGLEEAEKEYEAEKAAKKAAKQAEKDAKKAAKKAKNGTAESASAPVSKPDIEFTPEPEAPVTDNPEAPEVTPETPDSKTSGKKSGVSFFTAAVLVFSVILGIGISILLFVFIPTMSFDLVAKLFPSIKENYLIRSVYEAVLKIVILIAYMAAVSLMKDIKRTFMFHGAEHKAIFCYEAGLELTVENVRKQKRFHPRCGTSFLVLMVIVGIFIGLLIPRGIATPIRFLIKLLLLPFTVGIGYELIKLAGRYDNLFTRIISAPGTWLQHITTKEPDDGMIECAIEALKRVIPEDGSDKW